MAANGGSNTVSILVNQGSGTFATQMTNAAAYWPMVVCWTSTAMVGVHVAGGIDDAATVPPTSASEIVGSKRPAAKP